MHLSPCAENPLLPRQRAQHMRLYRAYKGRGFALRGNKIEPAPAIKGVKGQSKHLVGDRIGFAKIIKKPAIKMFTMQRLLDSIEVHDKFSSAARNDSYGYCITLTWYTFRVGKSFL